MYPEPSPVGGPLSDRTLALNEPFAGRYRIERELGRGGMATVYLAGDLKHEGRQVALKVLRPEIAALLGRERFLREIDLVARLNHPHILPLHDSDEARPGTGTGPGQLYYVMPFVAGGTLRDRLAETPRMPVQEALELSLQVADALSYAHGLGVVHRDIKPGNILLAEHHAYVADFGIARAIRQMMTAEQLTESGLVLGTPAYMAPEQFQGASKVDGRADEYALACVLYEALIGAPPDPTTVWSGSSQPSLRKQRPDLPPHVDAAIRKALAAAPAQRFDNVAAFAGALRGERRPGARPWIFQPQAWRRVLVPLVVALVAVTLWAADRWIGPGRTTEPDSTRYAVLPFEYGPGVAARVDEELRLRSALRRWRGIEPVDPVRVREEVARRGSRRLTGGDADAVSRAVDAGRYLRGTISRAGDSLQVEGALYAVHRGGDSLLAEHTVRLGSDIAQVEQGWADLVDHLLLRSSRPAGGFAALGTSSLPAWQAFSAGQRALREWRLAAADSAFGEADRHDPDFVRSDLWLGLSRLWNGAEPARWQHAAEQAAAGRTNLPGAEGAMAEALVSTARGELDHACGVWRSLVATAPDDFAVWYGWADCQRSDEAVLRDARSPSGWRFRSSYRSALRAYQRAFLLRPAVLASFRSGSYRSIRALLKTSGTDIRLGSAVPPDSGQFLAWPAWYGDTLGFVPYPAREFQTFMPGPREARAVQEQRRQFQQIALAWVTATPGSADALEALGISLELLGDPSAIDTLRRARALTRGGTERLRAAGEEVWAMVRFAIPNTPERLRPARALADSLLHDFPPGTAGDPGLLASLAALTGHASLAAAHAQRAAVLESWSIPPPLMDIAPALLTFAALGGPRDSLESLEGQALALIEKNLPEPERGLALDQWLGRAASLAFSDWEPHALPRLRGRGYLLLDAQAAFQRGDRDSARAILAGLRRIREGIPPATLTLDALYPEARLLVALGDTTAALGWMQPTLSSLRFTAPDVLADPWRAASLVRALALQAELAAAAGHRDEAARWARCAAILWSGADDFLQPVVRRLLQLAR